MRMSAEPTWKQNTTSKRLQLNPLRIERDRNDMLEQEMVEMDHAGMAEQLEKIAELRRDVLKELANRDGRLGKELERLN